MKQTIATLLILGASLSGYSQDKNFDLSKYKFPDYKRHELELNFNSSGNSSSWSDINGSNPDGTWKTVDYNDTHNFSDIYLGYSFTKNSRKKMEYVSSHLNSSYFFQKSTNEMGTTGFNNPSADFSIYAGERHYLTEDKWFLEANPRFDFEIWSTTNKSPAQPDLKNRGHNFTVQLGLGGGIGRKEDVTEFWQAYYILEELKKQGLISRNPSEKDIYELATLASQLKSKRFFDSRLKKMEEMKSLDSLMHKIGLIDRSDITYFNTLNDNWNFANISYRSSGRILKALVTSRFSQRFDKELGALKHTYNETYLKSEIDFQCSKQMNLYWERNFNLNFSNALRIDNNDKSFYKYPKNFQQINSNIGLNYYPNFRTQIKFLLIYQASQFASGLDQTNTKYKKVWSNSVALIGSVYYYLSPQLRIEGNLGANYYDKKQSVGPKEKLDISYNLGFRYAIF